MCPDASSSEMPGIGDENRNATQSSSKRKREIGNPRKRYKRESESGEEVEMRSYGANLR